jgi:methionine synthase II (cobalamin-independent)
MEKQRILKPFTTTGIGTLPHKNAKEAVSLALQGLDVPFWPQLPNISFRESMIPQYSEGMPSLKIDAEHGKIWVERNEEEIARFYEFCGEDARIAISEEYAKGFYVFMDQIKARQFDALKGHVTGPLTFTLGLNDSAGKAIYFDEEFREISLMLLRAKIRWQVDMLKPFAGKIIIFIDEPILSALGGTSYMGVSPEETVRMLRETVRAVQGTGALAGIHCCGRADWPLVLESGLDILNFDFFEFGETLSIYPDEITAFIESGGYLAWGIVPTTDAIAGETEESIVTLTHALLDKLSKNIDGSLLQESMILTPSCGTGSRSIEEAIKIFQILMRLKESFTK